MRQSILESLAELADIEAVHPELTDYDNDETDSDSNPYIKQLEVETKKTTDLLFYHGHVIDETHDELLADIHTLLRARIDFFSKVEVLGMAVILWPTEGFESESAVLMEFIAAHDIHIRSLKSYPASALRVQEDLGGRQCHDLNVSGYFERQRSGSCRSDVRCSRGGQSVGCLNKSFFPVKLDR